MPFSLTLRIGAPDEASARDLADGGLLVFDARAVRAGRAWYVQCRCEPSSREAIDALVRSWLRRRGLERTVVTESARDGTSSTTIAARGAYLA